MKDWQNSPWTERILFLLIILIEAGIFFYLIGGRWIVGGHDGFQYFTAQYYLLNNVVNYDAIPQWVPFMMHGTSAMLGYIVSGAILQNILFLSGSLFKNVNFLTLFYAGFFVDQLLLLAGVWLLARRFFVSPFTVFFVALSIMGSCVWLLQPWGNFHFYYAIPLILYLVHLFLDSGKWRYYFLAGNLLFMQSLGNVPYYLPVISLVIFLYFLFYAISNYEDVRQKIKAIRFSWPFISSSFLIILSFAALSIAMNIGADQIVSYSPMRSSDSSTTLNVFLTYGGNLSWRVWLELFLGISPCLDYTLYTGIFCVPFILLGLIFNVNRRNIHFLLTIVILLLFGMGTFVSVFFYYSWPMMKFFRHLILISPIIKVFLCFLAGWGFDAVFFNKSHWKNPLVMKVSLAVLSVFMLGISLLLYALANNYYFYAYLIRGMVSETLPMFITLFREDIMASLLSRTTLFALTASILFAVLSLMNRQKYILPLVIMLLALHCADIYSFKFSEIRLKAVPLNDEMYKITAFQPMPYAKRRDVSFQDNNPRAELLKVLPIQKPGAFYWSMNAFLFKDELGNPFRTDFWLLPLDNYMRAYWGQSIHDLSVKPKGLFYDGYRLEFPRSHPAALKISGVTEDKIQFFSGADFASSDDAIVSNITNTDYKGDIIFLSPPEKNKNINPVNSPVFSENNLSANKRLHLPYSVKRFDSNNLEVTTSTHDVESAWLLYSDVWHPFWRATVNGKETPVYKANLAYKAVKLEKGFNAVHFYFKSGLISAFHLLFCLNALLWFVIIIYLTGNIAVNNRCNPINYQKSH
ncbi:MAG: hypothetical protein CVU55_03230 [Deltaproteobacteria bacterium HGW-Deltaproteobacteria-13]|jgi:hypothetical protein|nr:MAG: hypothetical protein CVU55_03230 [Deltaproteobacteria bacterium HGW-Deltaproteobacteria-13]